MFDKIRSNGTVLILTSLMAVSGCMTAPTEDAGPDATPDAPALETSVSDGTTPDAGDSDPLDVSVDVLDVPDSVVPSDVLDASTVEISTTDASLPDVVSIDTGVPDAGSTDAGMPDAIVPDAGPVDTGVIACSIPLGGMLQPNTSITNFLRAGTGLVPTTSCGGATPIATPGVERGHAFTVASDAIVELTTSNTSVDTVLTIRRLCDSVSSQIACNDDANQGIATSRVRSRLSAGTWYAVVDEYGTGTGGAGGNYTLRYDLLSTTPASNNSCGTALPLPLNSPTQVSAVHAATASHCLSTATSAGPLTGSLLFYTVTVPAGQRLSVSLAAGVSTVMPYMLFSRDCNTTTVCSSISNAPALGGTATANWDNTTTASQTVYLSVTDAAQGKGPMTLTASLSALPAAPVNAMCSLAPLLTQPNGTLTGQRIQQGSLRTGSAPCAASSVGPSLYYKVTVPPQQRFNVYAIPRSPALDLTVRFFTACGATRCEEQSTSAPAGQPEHEAGFSNDTNTAQTVVFEVQSTTVLPLGTFDLAWLTAPFIPNGDCLNAAPLTPGVSAPEVDPHGAGSLVACGVTEPFAWYSVTVPAAMRARVTVTSNTAGAPTAVFLVGSCGGFTCLGQATSNNVGGISETTYTNTTGAPRTILVAATGAAGLSVHANLETTP